MERTTRRAVAAAKKAWRYGHRRVFQPWAPEPGLWLQFDRGDGPKLAGRGTMSFSAPAPGSPFCGTPASPAAAELSQDRDRTDR